MAGHVSEAVLRRLPRYYRYLKELESDNVMQISSQELAERMGLTASQIRQDINCSGGEGRQGFGYSVPQLRRHIGDVLGIQHKQNMIIVGAGNIGRAVALSDSFSASNFNTVAIFDVDPDKIGKKIGPLTVQNYEEIDGFIKQHPVHIAMLAVPVSSAQSVVDKLHELGINAYWNFVPIDLNIPQNTTIVSVHLEEGLQILSYKIKENTPSLSQVTFYGSFEEAVPCMTDRYPKQSSMYTPRSSQPAPHYSADTLPSNAETVDFTFDEITSWNTPLERLSVDQPVRPPVQIGENPFAQKRSPLDPLKEKSRKKKNLLLAVYLSVIAFCLIAVLVVGVMMMPQLAGYFWADLDNYAFINGELLRYDEAAVLAYKQYRNHLQQDIIFPGIFIDGTYVGGLTTAEAKAELGDENTASDNFTISINIGDKSWTLNNQNVSAHRDINGALLKAYSYGRQNTTAILNTQRTPFRERTDTVMGLRENFVYLQSKQAYDYHGVQAVVDEIQKYVTRDPVDAQIVSFDFNSRTFTFSDDQPGVTIDGEALYNQLIALLDQGVHSQSVTVSPALTLPTVTKKDLEATFKMITAFTTDTTSSNNRNNNISVACQAINGTVLLPGETFSFNTTVGERTLARGYQEAGAISGGELVQEIGGGICQVSSTLFNAVARADLQIVSRSPHAWPSTYVKKGEDATVNWPDLDFKFKNNKDTPVFVITYYKNRQCTAEIWGVTLGENVTIDLDSTVTKTLNPSTEVIYLQNTSLPPGTSKETVKMRIGYVVDTYKIWYQNGVEYKRDYFYTSTYKAYQKTIEYNQFLTRSFTIGYHVHKEGDPYMNLLITGADGFVGRNLRAALRQSDHRLLLIDVNSSADDLQAAAGQADFVFHLAGVNRPKDNAEFQTGNADFTSTLLNALEQGKRPPVLISSSTQAALDNPYGKSKLAAEKAVRQYFERVKSPVYIYRLTNVFGKWSKPNYNSAVATFCYNIARDLPVTVTDPAYLLRLVYIDDVVSDFLRALNGNPAYHEDGFCTAGPEHEATLQHIVSLLQSFHSVRTTLTLPDQQDPFVRKLFATYQSFLPPDQLSYVPLSHADSRGSFTELMHMGSYGQISVNVTKPGICKGSHWHHTKHEKFIVVSGRGSIRFRNPYDDQIYSYEVTGGIITVIDVPPGYVHIIENTGADDLVTLMWASEVFNPEAADTFPYNFDEHSFGEELL